VIYSKSAEYAIRALVHLAGQPEGQFILARNIAHSEAIPAHFLAKILQQLAKRGLLRSVKGQAGGFTLRQPATTISLLKIVEAVDGEEGCRRCIAGMSECSDETVCPMHDSWKGLRSRIMEYLERTSIEDLASALEQKRRLLETQHSQRRGPARKSVSH